MVEGEVEEWWRDSGGIVEGEWKDDGGVAGLSLSFESPVALIFTPVTNLNYTNNRQVHP